MLWSPGQAQLEAWKAGLKNETCCYGESESGFGCKKRGKRETKDGEARQK